MGDVIQVNENIFWKLKNKRFKINSQKNYLEWNINWPESENAKIIPWDLEIGLDASTRDELSNKTEASSGYSRSDNNYERSRGGMRPVNDAS